MSSVSFSPSHVSKVLGGDEVCARTDFRDHNGKPRVQFESMLCAFAEKNRTRFFDYGGIGRKWSKTPFPEFSNMFDELTETAVSGQRISLTTQAVPNYPAATLVILHGEYDKSLRDGPRLNWAATPFVPGGEAVKPVQGLARTSPYRVAGVTLLDQSPPNSDLALVQVGEQETEKMTPRTLSSNKLDTRLSELEERMERLLSGKQSFDPKSTDDLEQRMARLLDLADTPVCFATPV